MVPTTLASSFTTSVKLLSRGWFCCCELIWTETFSSARSLASASMIDLSPVSSAKYIDISSSDRPFVSGTKKYTNAATIMHTIARSKKNPAHEMACAVERKVDAISVAATRLRNVAMLMALVRIVKENTSDGINHAPGPIPKLKKERYIAREHTANAELCPAKKLIERNKRATVMPVRERKKSGLRPLLSNSRPARNMHDSFSTPRKMSTAVCAPLDLMPDSSMMNTRKY
mmetsp:Transcript_38687/g.116206  ORF Transcript_38687/g.116206 Transcript_38687/m.116206 type:complete len:230 (+) Transcript_38687:458-1147(+)